MTTSLSEIGFSRVEIPVVTKAFFYSRNDIVDKVGLPLASAQFGNMRYKMYK
jgi:hypothetical protein